MTTFVSIIQSSKLRPMNLKIVEGRREVHFMSYLFFPFSRMIYVETLLDDDFDDEVHKRTLLPQSHT